MTLIRSGDFVVAQLFEPLHETARSFHVSWRLPYRSPEPAAEVLRALMFGNAGKQILI